MLDFFKEFEKFFSHTLVLVNTQIRTQIVVHVINLFAGMIVKSNLSSLEQTHITHVL